MAGWLTPLKAIAASLAQSGLTEQLDNAALEFSKKQALLRPVFPANAAVEVHNLVSLLASKNEVHLLPQIIAEFERYAQRGPSVASIQVTSAVPLTDPEKSTLETKMRAQFGGDAAFEYVVDPTILGGVIVRMGDKVIDGSVSGKLAALKEKLK
jgi:F-type H+-transporting ATPase subunit delta